MKVKKKNICVFIVICILCSAFLGCNGQTFAQKEGYRGRVFYEIFVRAFNDSNGDGIGDLKGVTQKLDYLKSLGIKGIWLMPINPSPSYHGYDVTDYYTINPDYGTLDDYKELIKEAHKRDIMVIMDLVLNHTSTEHPWFKQAASDKNSKYRNYYFWSDSSSVEKETSPISAKPWNKLGNEYYYALFSDGMPDLNYNTKEVREEMKKAAKFYLGMGVDGFRLDAAKWIFNDDVNNIIWWKEFRSYVKSINKNAVLVGEVWDDADKISIYEEALDSCFDFPDADDIVNSVSDSCVTLLAGRLKDNFDLYKDCSKDFVISPFLTNHDMTRVMSKLDNVDKAKAAAAIYLTLPGTPFVYYGEETGMEGAKPDEQIRQPFIWNNKDESKNSSWEASTNEKDKTAVNVQENDKNSMLNFYKDIINLRNKTDELKYGDFKDLSTKNDGVIGYTRTYNGKTVYVYINVNKEKASENIGIASAEVLYSNKGKGRKLNFKGTFELQPYEILIVK